jgi:hypothetical protein
MDKQTPTRTQRSSKKQTSPEVTPSVDQVDEQTTQSEMPCMKRSKIGEPTIGRSPDFVETIGLGNLTVITANGKRNYD